MRRTAYYLISLIFCACAENKTENDVDSMYIDINSAKGFISGEAIMDTTNSAIIPLESDKVTIGYIEDCKIRDNNIYIVDGGRRELHVFEINGKYLGTLSHSGKAENEYIEISDFYVTESNIYILDNPSRKILLYNNKYGFVSAIKIHDYWANNLFVIDRNIFLVNEGSDCKYGKYHIFKINERGEMIDKYIPFDYNPGLVCENPFAAQGDTIWYCQRDKNTVYKITDNGCDEYLRIDFGQHALPEKYKKMDAKALANEKIDKSFSLGIQSIKVSDNYIFMSFYCKGQQYLAIYDVRNGCMTHLCRGIVIDFGYHVGLMNYVINDNCIFDINYADELLHVISSTKADHHPESNDLIELYSLDITMDDNPVIFQYTLN